MRNLRFRHSFNAEISMLAATKVFHYYRPCEAQERHRRGSSKRCRRLLQGSMVPLSLMLKLKPPIIKGRAKVSHEVSLTAAGHANWTPLGWLPWTLNTKLGIKPPTQTCWLLHTCSPALKSLAR